MRFHEYHLWIKVKIHGANIRCDFSDLRAGFDVAAIKMFDIFKVLEQNSFCECEKTFNYQVINRRVPSTVNAALPDKKSYSSCHAWTYDPSRASLRGPFYGCNEASEWATSLPLDPVNESKDGEKKLPTWRPVAP